MARYIFDLEADNLLDDATRVHCGVFKDMDTGDVTKFTPDTVSNEMLAFMDRADTLVGHNVIGYDFPLLEKLFGYEYKGRR